MSFLIAVHDVVPPFEREARELWALCFAHGVRPALVVVPTWHGDSPLRQHARFTNWLFARADQGARILLGGDRHEAHACAHSRRERQRLGRRGGRAGEHLAYSYETAREGLARGILSLQGCGLTPTGFVPPDWRARAETRRAARDEGLALLEDTRFVWRLADETPIAAPVVRWHARSSGARHLVARQPDVRWTRRRHAPLTRLVLFPNDAADASGRATLERSLGRWLAAGEVASYGELVHAPSARCGAAA